ncbi:MAG: hypothetical protein ABIG42_06620, partial [bacterium]
KTPVRSAGVPGLLKNYPLQCAADFQSAIPASESLRLYVPSLAFSTAPGRPRSRDRGRPDGIAGD